MGHGDHHEDPFEIGERRLWWAVSANILLTVAQVIGGILSGALSLVADALHNFSDAASLLIALVAIRIGHKPPDQFKTFGYKRAETVAALINLTTLIIIGLYLCYEAILRFIWLRHLSLFSNRGDKEGVYPRKWPNRTEEAVMNTFKSFYGTMALYDLTRQWILMDGPFVCDFKWISENYSQDNADAWADSSFKQVFGITLDQFEIVECPHTNIILDENG